MLMMTPEFRRKLGHALGVSDARRSVPPVTLPRTKLQKPARQLAPQYRQRLIRQTAAILRRGEPSVFAFEGFMRHGLRSGLCRKGWGWHEADEASAKIVSAALSQIGAQRPTWRQGQPEWAQDGFNLVDHSRCVRCNAKLSRYKFKFCTKRCSWAYHASRSFEAKACEAVYDDAP